MHPLEAYDIAIIVAIALVVIVLAWLSLIMASVESAVGQVTRASLNNLILEEQTSDETQFTRMKHIDRIHHVQRHIDERYATGGACTFFRVLCNIITGTLVAVIAGLCGAPLWVEVLSGVVFALLFGIVTVKVRPRSMGAAQPLQCLLRYSRLARIAVTLAPFARDRHTKHHVQELSDDEELEKLLIKRPEYRKDMLRDYDIMEAKKSNEYIERFVSLNLVLTIIKNNKNYEKSSDSISDEELQKARDCLWKLYGSYIGWTDYLISNPVALETKTELTEKTENRRKEMDNILADLRKVIPIIEVTDQEQKDGEKRGRRARGIESDMITYLEQGLKKHNDRLEEKLQGVKAE